MKLTPALAAGLLIGSTMTHADHHEDPYLWLEDVEGEKALAWARERNEESLAVLKTLPEYDEFFEKNLAVYDSQERIATPAIRGEHVYNFWRDAKNVRGLWRRTTIADYENEEPSWEILLDLDQPGAGQLLDDDAEQPRRKDRRLRLAIGEVGDEGGDFIFILKN